MCGSSLPQISMASCTTSPTPTGKKLKWWLASPWSSTRSCRSMEPTRWGAETNTGCGVEKGPTPVISPWFLSLEPRMVSCLDFFFLLEIKTEWGQDCLHAHPEAPRGLLCHVREREKKLLRLTLVTGSAFVWGSALTESPRSSIWMSWLLSSLVSASLWDVESSSGVTSTYRGKTSGLVISSKQLKLTETLSNWNLSEYQLPLRTFVFVSWTY